MLMEEILQLIGGLSHYLHGFVHPGWCKISSINSVTLFSIGFFKTQECGGPRGWIPLHLESSQTLSKLKRSLQFYLVTFLQMDPGANQLLNSSSRWHLESFAFVLITLLE